MRSLIAAILFLPLVASAQLERALPFFQPKPAAGSGGSPVVLASVTESNVSAALPIKGTAPSATATMLLLGSSSPLSSPSWAGQSLTAVAGGTLPGSYPMSFYYLLNPTAGASSILNDSGSTSQMFLLFFTGVNQSTPFGTAVSRSSGWDYSSTNTLTTAATSFIFDELNIAGGTVDGSWGTNIVTVSGFPTYIIHGGGGSGSQTLWWTFGSGGVFGQWSIEIKAQ